MAREEWFVSWFSTQEYVNLYSHRDEHDAKKIIRLISRHIKLKRNSEILDLACGSGRHSMLLAGKGYRVTGIDLSRFLISQARKKLNSEYKRYRDRLRFEIRDMRKFLYPKQFDLIVNIFTSFGYFRKDSDNEKVIKCASNSLRRNGYFLIDFLNREHLLRNLKTISLDEKGPNFILQVRKIIGNFVVKDIYFGRKSIKTFELKRYRERIKLYSLEDFRKMFKKYNLKISRIFGDYDGRAYNRYRSPRLILIGHRV